MRRKLFLVFAVLFGFLFFLRETAFAEDAEQRLNELQEKIKAHQKKLKDIKKSEVSTLGELEKANLQILNAESNLNKQSQLLRETESNIKKVRAEISKIEAKLAKQKGWMKKKLRALYKYGNLGDALILLASSEDFSQLIRRLQYIQRLTVHEHKTIQTVSTDLKALHEKQKAIEGLYVKQRAQENQLKNTIEVVSTRKKEKELLLASIKKEMVLNEQLVKEMEESSKRLIEIIRKSEEKETFTATGFRNFKGKLPWPVDGEVAIPYGRQKDPQFNTIVFRNGIYIKTPPSVSARSISDGQVVFAEWFKGYGQLVIVNHGDGYHSLYANLSEIFLKIGDIIKRGTNIGRVGESLMLNAPSLYFEIRYKGKPLDPAQWLRAR
ncbi:MAG: peptidoglycan DD-metalloendopeptidase family protein [Nitrospirae bacterium]|nr:peptidoglycan DD-metalloendopeptidase family protein [Nitrospirota bacterium]